MSLIIYDTSYNSNSGPSLIHNDQSAAEENSRIAQSYLDAGGYRPFMVPGVYYFSKTLFVPSNTDLHLGHDVEFVLADNSNVMLLANKNALVTGETLSAAVVWNLGQPSFQATITQTGIASRFPVDSWFGLLGLPNTNSSNRDYQGVWKVIATPTADSITFNLKHQPPSGGNSATGGVIYPADTNITVRGGILNGNGANQPLFGSGDPRSDLTWFRNVHNLTVRDIIIKPAKTWSIASNNVRDYVVENIRADTYQGIGVVNAKDIVHLAGGHRNVLVKNITASCSDNIVGMTLDVLGPPGNASYPFYDPGDNYDIVVEDIHGINTSAALVTIWGNVNYFHNSTQIRRVSGKNGSGGGVTMGTYVPTNMLNCNGGKLVIEDVTCDTSSPVVDINGGGTWNSIEIRRVYNEAPSSSNAVVSVRLGQSTAGAVQTIRHFSVDGLVFPTATGGRTAPFVDLSGSTVDLLTVKNIPSVRLGANTSAIRVTGANTTISNMIVEKVTGVSNAAGDSFIVSVENTVTPVASLIVKDCTMTGIGSAGSQSGGIVRQATSGLVTSVTFINVRINNCEAAFVGDNATPTTSLNIRGIEMFGVASLNAVTSVGPLNCNVSDYVELVSPTNPPFRAGAASRLFFYSLNNIGRLTNQIDFVASANLRVTGTSARADGANVNSPQPGDIFWNTNAAALTGIGMKGRTNAGAWANIF